MDPESRDSTLFVIARSESDEAIQATSADTFWIASAFAKASADKSRSLSSGRALRGPVGSSQ